MADRLSQAVEAIRRVSRHKDVLTRITPSDIRLLFQEIDRLRAWHQDPALRFLAVSTEDEQPPVSTLASGEPVAGRWRVGHKQDRNLYEGDRYVGVCFDAADAARIVAAMNREADRG